jgi:hypothetical protein
MNNFPKILFFINKSVASKEEKQLAEQYGPNCVFRHAGFANNESGIEDCDGVAGSIPVQYSHLPKASEAFAKFKGEISVPASKPVEPPKSTAANTWKPNA